MFAGLDGAKIHDVGDSTAARIQSLVERVEGQNDDRPAVISRLASALSDPDERVRESAISALGNLGSGQAVPALLKVLRDQSDFLGSSAAYALGRLAAWPQLCVPALVTAARTAGDRTRGSAIHALRKMGADGAAPLVAMLRDRDPTIRIAAAYALGDHGQQPPEVIDPLIDALGDTEREVRSAAARALRSIGPAASRSIPALIDALAVQTDFAQWALLAMGELAIPRLVSALASPYAAIRVGAADTLNFMLRLGGEPDWSEAVSTLVEALDDLDPEISFRAAVALRKVRTESKKAIPPRWQAFVERAFIETGGC